MEVGTKSKCINNTPPREKTEQKQKEKKRKRLMIHISIEQALQELGLWSGRGVPDSDWDDLIASATIAFAGLQVS
jgi:hypothetical protein